MWCHKISNQPMILVDEHKFIKRWLALIPDLAENLDLTSEKDRRAIEVTRIASYYKFLQKE